MHFGRLGNSKKNRNVHLLTSWMIFIIPLLRPLLDRQMVSEDRPSAVCTLHHWLRAPDTTLEHILRRKVDHGWIDRSAICQGARAPVRPMPNAFCMHWRQREFLHCLKELDCYGDDTRTLTCNVFALCLVPVDAIWCIIRWKRTELAVL